MNLMFSILQLSTTRSKKEKCVEIGGGGEGGGGGGGGGSAYLSDGL